MIRKRDDFLDYKASRKNRDKRAGKKREKVKNTNKAAVFIMVVISIGFGIGAYYISSLYLDDKYKEENVGGYTLYAGVYEEETETAGPYGLNQLFGEAEVTKAPEVEKRWMPEFVDNRTPVKVKGIYITFEGITKILDNILGLIDRTELNTLIVDVKDDDGRLTFEMHGELIDGYGTSRKFISDIEGTIKKLKEHNVYVIARIVSFKDPLLGNIRPDLVLHMKNGSIYKDYAGMVWLNPFKTEVLDYLVEIAENCAKMGFDEVNFDYIRFPTDGNISDIDLSEGGGEKNKIDAITEAVMYLCENIKPLGLYVSADVFGGIITSAPDQRNVGQSYVELSKYLDYICPMIYPSHYANGYYGVDYPDTQPYIIMFRALSDSQKVLRDIDEVKEGKALVRPWLQDFTASYLKHYIRYGSKEVRTQIDAVYDAGYEQWFLWNAAMNYTESALMTEEEAEHAYLNRPSPTPTPVPAKQPNATPTPKPKTGQYFYSPWKV